MNPITIFAITVTSIFLILVAKETVIFLKNYKKEINN